MRGSAAGDRISLAARGMKMKKVKSNKENLKQDDIRKEDGQTERERQREASSRDVETDNNTESKSVVETTSDKEIGGGPGDIFGRKPRVQRTPPMRRRTGSLPDEARLEVEIARLPWNAGNGGVKDREKDKRKRMEDSPVEGKEAIKGTLKKPRDNKGRVWESEYSGNSEEKNEGDRTKSSAAVGDKEYAKMSGLFELITSMVEEIKDLRQVVTQNQNTKVEIKKSSSTLEELVEQLEEEDYLTKLRELIEKGFKNEDSTARKEEGMETRSGVCAGTQTDREPWKVRNEETVERIRDKISKCDDLGEVLEVVSARWPKEVFRVTRRTTGNPIWDNNERDLAILIRGGNILDEPIGKQIGKRFPEFLDAPNCAEQVYTVLYEARTKTQEGNICSSRRTITAVKIDEDEGKTFQTLLKWKQNVADMGIKRVAVPGAGTIGETMRKLIECVFWGTEMTIMWYDTVKKKQGKGVESQSKVTRQSVRERSKATGAVLVKSEDKSYAELLRQVKNKVNVEALGVNIRGVRKTRDGELLLEVDKDPRKVESLQKEINKCFVEDGGVTARQGRGNDLVFEVRGIDATIPTAEIVETLRKEGNGKNEDVKVKATRVGFDGNVIATVLAPREMSLKLIELKKIRIGWSTCSIRERRAAKRCLKCWEAGHLASGCKGVDRRNLCLKCGKEGHKVQECKNPPFCPICLKDGHRADSMACPALRAGMEGLRSIRRGSTGGRQDGNADRDRRNQKRGSNGSLGEVSSGLDTDEDGEEDGMEEKEVGVREDIGALS